MLERLKLDSEIKHLLHAKSHSVVFGVHAYGTDCILSRSLCVEESRLQTFIPFELFEKSQRNSAPPPPPPLHHQEAFTLAGY